MALSKPFRTLRPDEIEVRQCGDEQNGRLKLLLYQDARCAQNLLDEYAGCMNWQKEYYEAKGLLFCRIGIRDEGTKEWVWKSDTGSESNIEADKGLASDAFKRAAVAWGIGRELYTAPEIKVSVTEKDKYNGKLCQTFRVSSMEVSNGVISKLAIVDKFGTERFRYEGGSTNVAQTVSTPTATPTQRPREQTREQIFEAFLEEKLKDPSNTEKVKGIRNFFYKPDKNDPQKTILETWVSLDMDKIWERMWH